MGVLRVRNQTASEPPFLSSHLVRISKTIPGLGPHSAEFLANKGLYTDPTSDLLEPALEA